jgi:hypothetical protein
MPPKKKLYTSWPEAVVAAAEAEETTKAGPGGIALRVISILKAWLGALAVLPSPKTFQPPKSPEAAEAGAVVLEPTWCRLQL